MVASHPLAIDEQPKRIGRPSLKTPAMLDEILERLANGESLTAICRDDHMPDFRTVWRWEDEDTSFCQASTRAREIGTHHIAGQCLEIADNSALDHNDRRIKIDTRLRLIGQWNRKVYGQALQVDVDHKISVRAALDQANARVIEGTSTRITTSSDEPSPDSDKQV